MTGGHGAHIGAGAGDLRNVADVPHIPWAFSLERAERLPLTGDEHPLRRELGKWLLWACGLTLVLALAALGVWAWLSARESVEAPVLRQVKIVRYADLGVPPSISRPTVPQVSVAQQVARIAAPPPAIAVPEPVADERARVETIATVSEMAEALEPVTLSDLGFGEGTGDSLVIDVSGIGVGDGTPSPDAFVAVEEEPVRISIDPPVYPDVARSAGIEGTVIVRVLVGKDGRIKDVIYVEGPEALREAALATARTAIFRPALMDNRPVEVWVVMPVTFKLRG
ncbi:MAG: energy transducer TonB [Candidatus Krumholzibacteriia bacterium]